MWFGIFWHHSQPCLSRLCQRLPFNSICWSNPAIYLIVRSFLFTYFMLPKVLFNFWKAALTNPECFPERGAEKWGLLSFYILSLHAIEWEENEISFLLVHFPTSHITLRTGLVNGGSLRYNSNLSVVVRKKNVTGNTKTWFRPSANASHCQGTFGTSTL